MSGTRPYDMLPQQGRLAPLISGGYKTAKGLHVSCMILHTYHVRGSNLLGNLFRYMRFPFLQHIPPATELEVCLLLCAHSSPVMVVFSSRYKSKQNLESASQQIISLMPSLDFIHIPPVVDKQLTR